MKDRFPHRAFLSNCREHQLDIAHRVGDNYGGRTLRTKEFLLAAGGKKYADL